VRVCTEYCKHNDLEVIEVYADRAIPGKTDKRPEFQRLIDDSGKKKFEAVVVYKTDRFSRNKYDSAIYKKKLKKNNIELHYAAEAIPQGPEGILMESLMEGLAEYYSAELSQKIRRGMHESALKCQSVGSNKPFGYMTGLDKTLQIDQNEANGVRMIFDMYIQGETKTAICERLNSLGFKTSQGNPFNKNSIDRIIKNEKYIGVYIYKDIRIEDGVPAIISKETFYAAQREREKRRTRRPRKKPNAEYLLSGKLYCGKCKSPMTGISGTSKTGNKFYYYICNKAKIKDCDMRNVPRDWLENYVVKQTVQKVLRPDVLKYLSEKLCVLMNADNTDEENIKYCEKKLADNKKAIDNLIQMAMDGLGTKSISDKIKALEAEQLALKGELEHLNRIKFKITAEQIEFMLISKLEAADNENYNKYIIDTFVSEVYYYDDKILIFYNIKNDDRLHPEDLKSIESERCSSVGSSGGAEEN